MNEKKIIFLVPWLSGYGGTETVIHNLFKEYYKNRSKLNLNFELYSLGGFLNNINLHFTNVHVIQLFNNKYLREIVYLFLLPLLIPYIIIKSHANVVVATNPVLWTISKLFIRMIHRSIPVVAWYQYSYNAKHVKKYYINQPDYFLTISAAGKKELLDKGITDNRISVVYDPVIPSKKVISHSHYNNQFIYVGRIEYGRQKNLREMFIALSKLKKAWYLNIYGNGLPKEINSLKMLSRRLHISKHIRWVGFQENVFDHIKNADALLLTSNYEGFSMVIAEAIAHGLYVISSNCPNGPSELISKDNGNLYPMHNISELDRLLNMVLNGRKHLNHNKIKKSISEMYISKYFINFISSLYKIMK